MRVGVEEIQNRDFHNEPLQENDTRLDKDIGNQDAKDCNKENGDYNVHVRYTTPHPKESNAISA